MQGDSKEEDPKGRTFYSSETINLDAKDHSELVQRLVDRLLRVLPLDHLDLSGSEALFLSRDYGHQGRLELQIHADINVWVDSQDKRVGILYHERYRFEEETARTILRVLYCEPTLEFSSSWPNYPTGNGASPAKSC